MRNVFVLSGWLAAVAVLASPPAWPAHGGVPFFQDAFIKASALGDEPAVVRSRAVTADLSGLLPGAGRNLNKAALRLHLNLFPDAAGGREAIENRIALAIDETNLALERSRVLWRVRLVHLAEVPYDEDETDIGKDLQRLQKKGDTHLEKVHALRDAHGADTVSLIRNARGGSCGIGFLLGHDGKPTRSFEKFEFSVVSFECLSGLTLPHEMGHNWGNNHSRQDPRGKGAFAYSYGYKAPSGDFRTVMAYDCPGGCPRIPNYSDPEVSFDGQPTGVGNANNALSLDNIRGVLANFRLSEPSGGASCGAPAGRFAACSGGGCSVCAEKLINYPLYVFNHPDCDVSFACTRKYSKCSADCPPPAPADTCGRASSGWRGCGANGCAVCADVEAEFPNYFRNHPPCTRDLACRAGRSACNAACPVPGEADR